MDTNTKETKPFSISNEDPSKLVFEGIHDGVNQPCLAELAYVAFCKARLGASDNGYSDYPAWCDLGPELQSAWAMAAGAVLKPYHAANLAFRMETAVRFKELTNRKCKNCAHANTDNKGWCYVLETGIGTLPRKFSCSEYQKMKG